MAGQEESLASLWEKVTTEVDHLVANRQRGVSSVEDFAVDRACTALEKLRQQANCEKPDSYQGTITRRSVIAMEEHRCRVLQDMINEAKASLEAAQQSRKELEKELEQVAPSPRSGGSLAAGRSPVQSHLQELQAEIATAQDEVRQLEGETAALAAERQRVEHLIAEANQRKARGIQGVRNGAIDSGPSAEENVSAIRDSEPGSTSATAAFLNSGQGRGKLDLTNGSLQEGIASAHGAFNYLSSHLSVDETHTTAEVGSVASSSTQGYAATSSVFDTIQERLALLREKCADPASRAPKGNLDISGGEPQVDALTDTQKVLQKLEMFGSLRNSWN